MRLFDRLHASLQQCGTRVLTTLALFAGLLVLSCQADAQPGDPPALRTTITLRAIPDGRPVLLDLSAEADSALTTGVDSARVEWAWCLLARVDSVARIVTVDSVVPGVNVRSYPDSVQFACPHGTAPAHLHLLDHGHLDGPSPRDLATLWRALPARGDTLRYVRDYPFGLVVVRQWNPHYVKLYVFGLAGGVAP